MYIQNTTVSITLLITYIHPPSPHLGPCADHSSLSLDSRLGHELKPMHCQQTWCVQKLAKALGHGAVSLVLCQGYYMFRAAGSPRRGWWTCGIESPRWACILNTDLLYLKKFLWIMDSTDITSYRKVHLEHILDDKLSELYLLLFCENVFSHQRKCVLHKSSFTGLLWTLNEMMQAWGVLSVMIICTYQALC